MVQMQYVDVIRLYFDRSNALQNYWTLYVVIIGGLLAFSSIRKRPDWLTTALVTALFCCFAYKNASAIGDTLEQRFALISLLKDASQTQPVEMKVQTHGLEQTLTSPSVGSAEGFHIASDILTLAAVWAMELRRRRALPVAE